MTPTVLDQIGQLAQSLGIDAWGVASLGPVAPDHVQYLSAWLDEGMNADMAYLTRNHEVRTSPTQGILEDAKSVIVCAFAYYPSATQPPTAPQVSKYAYGEDYHLVIREKLQTLGERIAEEMAPHRFRAIVDTVPFLERYWAVQAGVGFVGRNKNLIIPRKGSFFFLGELLTTLELPSDHPIAPHCGTCHRCIDACPTQALSEKGLDARRCISYLTIEHKGEIPADLSSKFGRRLYGCDTCQDVCPHNHHPLVQSLFPASESILNLSREDLEDLTPERYKQLFGRSAASRAKYADMLRNARIWFSNNPD